MEKQLNLYITNGNIKEGALELLRHVRPNWSQSKIQLKIFTDGITNRLIGGYLTNDCDDMVLIRVYGEKTELFIDRKVEVRNIRVMHKSGLTPPLYCTFNNGICYGYAPGLVLDERMVRDPNIWPLISEMLARMHTLRPINYLPKDVQQSRERTHQDCHTPPEPCLFRGLMKFLSLIPSSFDDISKEKRFTNSVPKKDKLIAEVNLLESKLKNLCSPVVFCHNDLLLKNIIYNSDKKTVSFIDFEYADYNYQAFDIGNHFCEFAGVDTYDPNLYPDKEFQIEWLRNYLEAWHSIKALNYVNGGENGINKVSIETKVEILYNQVNHFALASHLYWGLWALVQSAHSTIEFDFLGYAIQRLQQYYSRRDQLFD